MTSVTHGQNVTSNWPDCGQSLFKNEITPECLALHTVNDESELPYGGAEYKIIKIQRFVEGQFESRRTFLQLEVEAPESTKFALYKRKHPEKDIFYLIGTARPNDTTNKIFNLTSELQSRQFPAEIEVHNRVMRPVNQQVARIPLFL